jgi:hydrogenase small subunit
MPTRAPLYEELRGQGVSRRGFLKFCAYMSSLMALPSGSTEAIAQALSTKPRPSVIWISVQECTGCSESLLRSFDPTLESLILDSFSLDYHHVLQAAAGAAAEAARDRAIEQNWGKYVLIVDGSIPGKDSGARSTTGGKSGLSLVRRAAQGAAVIASVGTCASFGGIGAAAPNPSGAVGAADVLGDLVASGKVTAPIVNVPGCPPIPEVITGLLTYYLTYGAIPPLDDQRRPKLFYGRTVCDDCPRHPFLVGQNFAKSFDDDGARQGWCLKDLGCKGPITFNACTTVKWNQGTSFPTLSGHGCLGCAEQSFWDRPGGFYTKPF